MDSVTTTNATPNILTSLGFKVLGEGVSLYEPDLHEKIQRDTDPTLILFFSWAFAQPKHIVKYIRPHQEYYSASSILLVQNAISNAVWKPDRWQMSGFFQPAAVAIQEHMKHVKQPRVLAHIFSNGAHSAVFGQSVVPRFRAG